jgi:hypothetical protein
MLCCGLRYTGKGNMDFHVIIMPPYNIYLHKVGERDTPRSMK